TLSTMLDFTRIKTPPNHGDTLVVPHAGAWLEAARQNHRSLDACDTPLLGSTLSAWRRDTRRRILGRDDRLVIVTGHQPEFIHPGVWAKHVAAAAAAHAAGGVAVNLVVDGDAPKKTALAVPTVDAGGLTVRAVPFAAEPVGTTYEQFEPPTPQFAARFEQDVHEAMGPRFADSLMPVFFRTFGDPDSGRDWVDRAVAARRCIEAELGVVIEDRRVSTVWGGPILLDMLASAGRFASCYNRALAGYRRDQGIRGTQRPIPDLAVAAGRVELPVWVCHDRPPRRRLLVADDRESIELFADDTRVARLPRAALLKDDGGATLTSALGRWHLRPRALALTLWARLLLADLFVHGIGGAKYDRISDAIIETYYGVAPPHMACVSATLHPGLPHDDVSDEVLRRLAHEIRDLTFNPQRHLPAGPDLAEALTQRAHAVARSLRLRKTEPRNRRARRAAYERIRQANATLLQARPDVLEDMRARLTAAQRGQRQSRIARGRDDFFGLYDRPALQRLIEALPNAASFGV
ncbi:MAG: hypothetical protein ACE5EX_11980, partial [Phycisphaerae bacterium]